MESSAQAVKRGMASLLVLFLFLDVAACVDTYCQSGPRNGTSCYSGATVRERDPLAPVAPMSPPGHGSLSTLSGSKTTSPAKSAPPEMPRQTALAAPGDVWLDAFPALPGARPLCDEHTMGGPDSTIREIHWVSFASEEPPQEIVDFYVQRGLAQADAGTPVFRAAGAMLEIHGPSDPGPACSAHPRGTERSIILVSRPIGRSDPTP
jgi:hypothetical protein